MKKRVLSILLLCCLLFTACSSQKTKVDLTEVEEKNIEESKEDVSDQVLFDKDVDIVLFRMNFDNSPIEEYVGKLQEENPDEVYSVYDDDYYIKTIKESERRELVDQMKEDEYIAGLFKDVFSSEQYGGAFLSIEYDDLLQNITLYVDKDTYQSAGMSASYGAIIVAMMYSDTVQAYNLVPMEERIYNVFIIDEKTGEILYDSTK